MKDVLGKISEVRYRLLAKFDEFEHSWIIIPVNVEVKHGEEVCVVFSLTEVLIILLVVKLECLRISL